MPRRADGLETKQKILEAAAELFASSGFKQTTNAEISQRSGVNSALISYYFGDKENIYREAWRLSSELASGKYPLLDADLPPLSTIERLRNIIAAAICHALDDRCWDNGIMQQEIASKTNLLDDVHNKTVFHLRETLIPVVSELLAEANSEENVRQTTLSIVALCIVPVQKIQNIEQTNPYNYDIEQRIDHVVEFVIAGIEAIKKIYEKNHHSN